MVHVGCSRKNAIAVVAPRQGDEFMVAPYPANELGDLVELITRDEPFVETAGILFSAVNLRNLLRCLAIILIAGPGAEKYPTESAAQAAADALRLTINNQSKRKDLRRTTVNTLWEHYSREELPLKEISTQDAYTLYVKNWILPRWGDFLLEETKTVEVERWLRAAHVADGTKAKIKCVLSALFSHAVRWEFCGHNPISSGIPVGTGGKRGPSTGVRISAKRRRSPLVLSPEQVKMGLAELEFRDQLLVFMDGALATRRGELGALRWMDCDFANNSFRVQHSYYWRRGGHLKHTKTEASAKLLPMHPALKDALLEWKSLSHYVRRDDFIFPSHRFKGQKPLDLAAVLKRKIQPAFAKFGVTGVGWHTFRHYAESRNIPHAAAAAASCTYLQINDSA